MLTRREERGLRHREKDVEVLDCSREVGLGADDQAEPLVGAQFSLGRGPGGRIVDQGSFDDLASRSSSSSLEAVFRKLTGTGDTADRVRRALDLVGGDLADGPDPRP